MNKTKAIKLAIEALKKINHKIAPEAKMGEWGSDVPYHQTAWKEYQERREAIEILESMK